MPSDEPSMPPPRSSSAITYSLSSSEISSLAQQVRSGLPSYLQWDESTESALQLNSTIPVNIHLDLLYSSFLLQRILVKRSLAGSETLISLAHQILKIVLTQIAISQRCGNPFSELGWTVSSLFFS